MNNELFQQARAAYARRDFQGALSAYTQCLQDASRPLAPGEMGLLYHQIGNCLVKLKDPGEAIHAYTQATVDASYDACGAVNYNLGMAYASLHDYEDAVKHFEIAVSDAKYDASYKAYTGMGNALLKLGKSAEAGVAFREAALDEGNPDPTKALLNLGVCFMALNRPADAVASYESALQFDMKADTRNKLYANLGQAYVACGQMQKAAAAFEEAIADKTYFLSDSASVDYQRAIAAVAQGTSEITQVIAPVSAGADMSGLDVAADGSAVYVDQDPYASAQDPYYYADPYAQSDQYGVVPGGEDRFFNASDEELEQWSKGIAKQERKRRNVGLKILVFIVLLVLVAFGAAVFLYTQGWGYPTQETVVEQLFADPQAAATTLFADEVPADSAASMVGPVAQDANPTIDGIDKSMSDSTAYVTAKTAEGGEMQYKVSLVRDLIGWKVSNVEIYFASQN
ncbi:tetratricopeptide repeat protein [Arabiibacter massiliensis]|uniref:tetratricopeptide repeat protein n=1 Tax=Arabiibacter massiliensis TaxID=1870985 RepID=UPI0009B9811E|nr:tetratricopeptide repeat protein [Arabiibacter massiliensis]